MTAIPKVKNSNKAGAIIIHLQLPLSCHENKYDRDLKSAT